MPAAIQWHAFADREQASAYAAGELARAVERALAGADTASLVLSGGSTPQRCLQLLGQHALDWERVLVIPSDERWVPVDSPDSNQAMLKANLLRGPAAQARLLGLYQQELAPGPAADAADLALSALPAAHAAVLLGMGEDGHFASLFPDAENLDQALALPGTRRCFSIHTKASAHQRLSLSLASLVNTQALLLMFFGAHKRAVFDRARHGRLDLPVHALLEQELQPVQVIYAP